MRTSVPSIFAFALICALCSPIQASNDGPLRSWKWFLEEANRVSCQALPGEARFLVAQDSAIFLAQSALTLISPCFSADDSVAASRVLNRLGDYHYLKEDLPIADSLWSEALTCGSPFEAIAVGEVEGSRFRLSILHRGAYVRSQNESLVQASTAFHNRVLSAVDTAAVRQLDELAVLHYRLGMGDSLVPYLERSIEAYGKHPEAGHGWAIHALIVLAESVTKPSFTNVPTSHAVQDSAIKLGVRARAVAESAFGPADTMVAWVLLRLGDYHMRKGDYSIADSLWQRAWDINRVHLAPENIEMQGSIDRMASIFESRGDFAQAEQLRLQAVTLREKTQGPGHPETAAMYMNLANFYRKVGKHSEAESNCRRALDIRERAVQQVPSDLAQCYRFLGFLASDEGRYGDAEKRFQTALRIQRRALGSKHAYTAASLSDLANLYLEWDRVDEAKAMFQDVLAVRESFLGSEHPDLAGTLENLAAIYSGQGRSDTSEALMRRSLRIVEKGFGREGSRYASSLSRLAGVQRAAHQYAQAEATTRIAMEIQRSSPASSRASLISMMNGLALALFGQGRIEDARTAYASLDSLIQLDTLTMNPDLASSLEDYARFSLWVGDPGKALTTSSRCFRIRLANFNDGVQVLSEQDALRYARFLQLARDLYITSYLEAPASAHLPASEIMETILSTKGGISDEIFCRNHRSDSEDRRVRAIRDSIQFFRAQLSHLYVADLSQRDGRGSYERMQAAVKARNRLETKLLRIPDSGRYGETTAQFTVERIMKSLPPNGVLIEYLRLGSSSGFAPSPAPQYVAAVFVAGGTATLRSLGSAGAIDSAVSRYCQHFRRCASANQFPGLKEAAEYSGISRLLSSLVLDPLRDLLPDRGTLIIAPDAALSLVAFSGLCSQNSGYLIERYRIHYVSAGRDLLRFKEPTHGGGDLVAFGDPNFDALPGNRVSGSKFAIAGETSAVEYASIRDIGTSCLDLSEIKVGRLSGARQEVEEVCRAWQLRTSQPAQMFLRDHASEEAIKGLLRPPEVLHLATHGYFLSEKCRSEQLSSLRPGHDVAENNPLLLSGLLLAGANRIVEDSVRGRGSDDGVLTAEEVSSLNLAGTQWVVLSACESGLGAIRNGEGLYGLRRAFQIAGARAVVCALWPISDQAATRSMTLLYEHAREPLPDIMRSLALTQLADLRHRGQPDHPYLWAPFIAIGDWHGIEQGK